MKRTLLATVATLGMLGCGPPTTTVEPPGGSNSMAMNPATKTFTCRAATQPSRFEYLVNGSAVTLTDPTSGDTLNLTLVSSSHGARPIYGSWSLPVQLDSTSRAAGLTLDATMKIAPTQVTLTSTCGFKGKTAVATATSSALVTDAEVSILDTKEDVKTINY